ncbi:hypothetical protein SteCoe_36485 [Stentor coeruleus]|uniref:Uncharacterized protein n=1 Tax=Stentor coeruleus TaxID=5963 RepID=A0A1R2AQ47_9CILI|nr:hypothetical protein SteCoe_36485 [Stentor coeruleus]
MHKEQSQIASRICVPLQEISDCIYEMLVRISSINESDPEYMKEFEVLLRRIKSQAVCMQGVIESSKIHYENYKSFRNFLIAQFNNEMNSNLSRISMQNILPILESQEQAFKHVNQAKACLPSSNALTSYFRSVNYIEEREQLYLENKAEYERTIKFRYNDQSFYHKAHFPYNPKITTRYNNISNSFPQADVDMMSNETYESRAHDPYRNFINSHPQVANSNHGSYDAKVNDRRIETSNMKISVYPKTEVIRYNQQMNNNGRRPDGHTNQTQKSNCNLRHCHK